MSERILYLTDGEKVKNFFGSKDFGLLDKFKEKENEKLSLLSGEIRNRLPFGVDEYLKDIILGEYIHENSMYNFFYGNIYGLICEYFGRKIPDEDFYHDYDIPFIYEYLVEYQNKGAFFPLPSFDFPVITTIKYGELATFKKNISELKKGGLSLDLENFEVLQGVFMKLADAALYEQMDVVFLIYD